jgi:hypothetical protein
MSSLTQPFRNGARLDLDVSDFGIVLGTTELGDDVIPDDPGFLFLGVEILLTEEDFMLASPARSTLSRTARCQVVHRR